MKLSILICTVPSIYRDADFLNSLTKSICGQITRLRTDQVQMLYLGDNKKMTVGEKRNKLLEIADGRRVAFVDDDDRISDDYVETLLSYCDYEEDCVAIGAKLYDNGTNEKLYDYSYKKNINFRDPNLRGLPRAGRMPNHLCLWKREIAKRVKFPHRSLGEDHEWAEKQIMLDYTLRLTEKVIYFYHFNRDNTLTRIR